MFMTVTCYLFSRTENLVLTITGRVDEEELFNTLRKTEEKVLRKRSIHGCEEFTRPWTSPIENLNLTEDLIYEIEYPSEDETLGKIKLMIRAAARLLFIKLSRRQHRRGLAAGSEHK